MKNTIVPAILAESFVEIEKVIDELSAAAIEFQVDVVDGKYVPATTWPFNQDSVKTEWSKLAPLNQKTNIELDLMVREPVQYFAELKERGFNRVIAHFGAVADFKDTALSARRLNLQLGLAIMNDDSLESVRPLLDLVDWVQVMGIKEIGKQGEPFDSRTLETIRELRALDSDLIIAVDGSVNADTIPDLLAAGANRLAVGSAILKQADRVAAYHNLAQLLPR